jgi:hypothetical protein
VATGAVSEAMNEGDLHGGMGPVKRLRFGENSRIRPSSVNRNFVNLTLGANSLLVLTRMSYASAWHSRVYPPGSDAPRRMAERRSGS